MIGRREAISEINQPYGVSNICWADILFTVPHRSPLQMQCTSPMTACKCVFMKTKPITCRWENGAYRDLRGRWKVKFFKQKMAHSLRVCFLSIIFNPPVHGKFKWCIIFYKIPYTPKQLGRCVGCRILVMSNSWTNRSFELVLRKQLVKPIH